LITCDKSNINPWCQKEKQQPVLAKMATINSQSQKAATATGTDSIIDHNVGNGTVIYGSNHSRKMIMFEM